MGSQGITRAVGEQRGKNRSFVWGKLWYYLVLISGGQKTEKGLEKGEGRNRPIKKVMKGGGGGIISLTQKRRLDMCRKCSWRVSETVVCRVQSGHVLKKKNTTGRPNAKKRPRSGAQKPSPSGRILESTKKEELVPLTNSGGEADDRSERTETWGVQLSKNLNFLHGVKGL